MKLLKFPKLTEDGKFCFKALFEYGGEVSTSDIEKWIEAWVEKNKARTIFNRSFYEEYSHTPSVKALNGFLSIEFKGNRNGSINWEDRMWKDWFVLFTKDLTESNLTITKLNSCEST